MFLPSSSISKSEALLKGFKPLTRAFYLPGDRIMLDKFQVELNGIDFCLVGPVTAPEIWRRNWISMTETSCIRIPFERR